MYDMETLFNVDRLTQIIEAVGRLSISKSPFLWQSGQGGNTLDPASVASKIRYATEILAPSRGFENPYPMSRTERDQMIVYHFETDLWKCFGLQGAFVPDELLKECQRRLQIAESLGTDPSDIQELRCFLDILDNIHHERKASSSSTFHKEAEPGVNWASLKAISPERFRRNLRPGFGDHFWALIIGIDAYPTSPLKGCLNDASLMMKYLQEYLNVPKDHIRFLKNATRAQMVNGLYDLRDDERIIRGDNILIHFSGHGTSYKSGDYFTTFVNQAGSIEGICPVDRGHSVPDISDRELNAILHELQKTKGNNITVFLDCCRSGGALRSHSPDSDGVVRYALPLRTDEQKSDLQAMIEAADNNPRRSPDTLSTCAEFWISEMGKVDGFVQLAGCHDFQVAKEGLFRETPFDPTPNHAGQLPSMVHDRLEDLDLSDLADPGTRGNYALKPTKLALSNPQNVRWNGCFTWALVNVLRSAVGRFGTYQGVIESIGGLGTIQNPVAIGDRKNSRLWFGGHLAEPNRCS